MATSVDPDVTAARAESHLQKWLDGVAAAPLPPPQPELKVGDHIDPTILQAQATTAFVVYVDNIHSTGKR